MWIVLVFWFAVYAIVVKIGLLLYRKLYGNKNILDKPQKWEDYIVQNTKFPIVIENDYLFKKEIATRLIFILFFLFGIFTSLTPISDSLDEIYRRLALAFGLFGLVFTIATRNKMSYKLFANTLYIKELDSKITYDYVTENGEIKTDVIEKNQIYSIKWSYFPYAIQNDTEIWITEMSKESKNWTYLFVPLYLVISIIYFVIYLFANKFTFNKYILFRTNKGIFAIQNKKLQLTQEVDFEWKSLINRYITMGGNYAN